jgi:hypothetical protein
MHVHARARLRIGDVGAHGIAAPQLARRATLWRYVDSTSVSSWQSRSRDGCVALAWRSQGAKSACDDPTGGHPAASSTGFDLGQ